MAIQLFRGLREASSRKPTIAPPTRNLVERRGYVSGIPLGGATATSPGGYSASDMDRSTYMQQLLQAYMVCPWANDSIDVVARTATAGGVQIVPNSKDTPGTKTPPMPPEVQEVQTLLSWVNPQDDVRQLMRNIITDLEVFGDAFVEVQWLLGKPVALYNLDCTTMTVIADEHGTVGGYHQKMPTGKEADFEEWEVIHIRLDSPSSGLYGIGPTQKTILPITSWLYTAALIKETMRRGDPLRAHVDWPMGLPNTEIQRSQQQYAIRNLGARNIGNLFETKGGATVQELGINRISDWLSTLEQRRDEIVAGYGVPPSKVSIVEAGNIGSGTGTSQEKSFMVNTVGPIQELVMEKFTSLLLNKAYGIWDWHCRFGSVDWRDDQVLEDIRDMRIRNGLWTLNKARSDVGEPPVPGGDDAFIVDRQTMVLYADLKALSKATVQATQAKGLPAAPSQTAPAPAATDGKTALTPPGSVESVELVPLWDNYVRRRRQVVQDLPDV